MKYELNKNIDGPIYVTEKDLIKQNANCPDSEKVGEGPGSCGGSKEKNEENAPSINSSNVSVDDMITFKVGPMFEGDTRDNGTETMHVNRITEKFIEVKDSSGKLNRIVPIADIVGIVKPSDSDYKQPSTYKHERIKQKIRHESTATKIERARRKGSKLI